MPIADKFAEAIGLEMQEVRRKSRAAKFDVRRGERMEDDGSVVAYSFEASSSQRLKEDSAIILIMPDGDRVTGTVLQHKGAEIRVSVERDLGKEVPEAQMMTDDTFLLMKMREAVVASKDGEREFNMRFAMGSIGEEKTSAGSIAIQVPGLNTDQNRSIQVAAGSEVSFLWGPPGTGKTATMSKLVDVFLKRGLSILIASNANLAVDTLLERVCADMEKAGELKPGLVVRYGTPVRESMIANFGHLIMPARIFDRENPGFETEMLEAERKMQDLMKRRQGTAARASVMSEIDRRREEVSRLERTRKIAESELTSINQKLVKLELRITSWKMKRDQFSPGEVEKSIREAEEGIIDLEDAREAVVPKVEAARRAENEALGRLASIEPAAPADVVFEWDRLQTEMDELGTKLRRGHERKAEYAKSLSQRAQIVAATAYQAYLAVLKKDLFDVVIIDEASMLPLPLVWLTSGLAKRHVVIAGDFRQLPTVAIANDPIVSEYYAKDPFVKAGIAAGADAGRLPPHAVALRVQYRMRRDICELINKPFYNGLLQTPPGQHEGPVERGVFAASTLSILDFRGFQPWGMRKATGSRLNPWQAVGLAAVGKALVKSGEWSLDAKEFGVITAYAAQAEALNECLRELGSFQVWPAATIHKFQGSEKDTIVFEVSDGRGLKMGGFFRGTADGIDQRLLNVAFSRARKRVVLVGNMEYIDRESVQGSAFSKLLAVFREKARRVDALTMLSELGPAVGVTVLPPPSARTQISGEIGKARQVVDIFLSNWRLKELVHQVAALKIRLGAGVKVTLRIDPGAEQAISSEPRVAAAVRELMLAGMTVDRSDISGQEAGLLIDRRRLWLIPAGGFGAGADTVPFMAADLPQFGTRLVAGLREATVPWGVGAPKAA